jgi:hypothetical protein
MSDSERFDTSREAAAAAMQTGPTAKRYRTALNRYVAAISAVDENLGEQVRLEE